VEIFKNLDLYLMSIVISIVISFIIGVIVGLAFFRFLVFKTDNFKNMINKNSKDEEIVEIKTANNSDKLTEDKKNEKLIKKIIKIRTTNNSVRNLRLISVDSKENTKNKDNNRGNNENKVKKVDWRQKLDEIVKLLGEELVGDTIWIIREFFLQSRIEIFVDISLMSNLGKKKGGRVLLFVDELLKEVNEVRKIIFSEWGVIIPNPSVKDDINLKNNKYVIKIYGVEVDKGEINGNFFAVGHEDAISKLNGKKGFDPLYGLAGVWISESELEHAKELGCLIRDCFSFISAHLQKVIEDNISEIFDESDYYNLLSAFEKKYFRHDFLRTSISYKVLKNLLSEGISIKQLRNIMSAIILGSNYTKDPEKLTEYVRMNIPLVISESFATPDKIIYAAKLDPEIEDLILRKLENLERDYVKICNNYDITSTVFSQLRDESDYYISYLQTLYDIAKSNIIFGIENSIKEYLGYCLKRNLKPVIVTSLKVRRAFKEILKFHFKNVNIFVISNFEIHPDYQVKFISNITSSI